MGRKPIFIVILLAALAACTQYSLVEVKKQTIGGAYSVDPQIKWSKTTKGKVELWTVDGPDLEAVRFYKGLGDGDTLVQVRDKTIKLPEYAAGMRATEIMEFVVDSIARGGAGKVDASNLRPAQFGTIPGFRFELSFLTSEGLEVDGLAVGAVIEEKLHLILYTGARAYYYPKYQDAVERIVGSIETI